MRLVNGHVESMTDMFASLLGDPRNIPHVIQHVLAKGLRIGTSEWEKTHLWQKEWYRLSRSICMLWMTEQSREIVAHRTPQRGSSAVVCTGMTA